MCTCFLIQVTKVRSQHEAPSGFNFKKVKVKFTLKIMDCTEFKTSEIAFH